MALVISETPASKAIAVRINPRAEVALVLLSRRPF
jgi:hypothetical protein